MRGLHRPETRDEDLPATRSGILDLVAQGERVGWNLDLRLSSYVFQPFWYVKALWDRQFVHSQANTCRFREV